MQEKPKPYLIYALNAEGKPVHVDNVPNGLSCGCKCSHCGSELIAKNGVNNKNAHHFSHMGGADCVGAVESAIHCLAKEILKESLCVQLPKDAGLLHFKSVDTEKIFPELKLRPDCVGYYGGKCLWVEFKRSHEVDAQKAGKIISAHIDCIEIDINECGQDKEKLREFITQSSEKRKWIYSSRYDIGLSENAIYSRKVSNGDESSVKKRKIARHFALEDTGKLVDLCVPSEFDAIRHAYNCPYCCKEVVLKVDDDSNYIFGHVEEDTLCDDEMYLRSTAVAAIYQAFVKSSKFVIDVPQYRLCKRAGKCPYSSQECRISTTQQYDLKSLGYINCKKGYKFSDVSYQTDLVFFREDVLKNPIEVRVNTENFQLEHETPRRLINVTAYDENDICRLEKGLLDYKSVRFWGFLNSKELAEPEEIQHEILTYTIYTSGKIHIGFAKCTDLSSLNKPNVIKKGVFVRTNGCREDLYIFLLLRYKTMQKELCRCQLCWSLKNNTCIRYKTIKSPKKPLQEKDPPKECSYFKMDLEILRREKELNAEIEIIELE